MARRHRVDERTVAVVAAVAGGIASAAGASPTGNTVVDVVVTFTATAFVVWSAATAPWWALTVTAAAATAIAGAVELLVVGVAAIVGASWIGLQQRDLALARSVVAALVVNVLVRAEVDPFVGSGAIVGVACGLLLVVFGVRRRRRGTPRRVVGVGVALAAGTLVAAVGAAVAAAASADDLRAGNSAARDAVERLGDGDYGAAADGFAVAAERFEDANSALDAPWARPAMLIPGVAQNRRAAVELAASAEDASVAIASATAVIDVDQLTLRNGRFDLDAIRLLESPLADVEASIDSLSATIAEVDSPWLVGALVDRLEDLDADLAEYRPQLVNAVEAVERVPAMLGADGPRHYFVAFTTPAEARGLGGFMGNWTVLTADDGRIAVAASGRTSDLNLAGDRPRTISGPDDWLEMWGRFGFDNGPGGSTGDVPWSNVTVSPQFPSTGAVMAELYPQSGGRPIDGVFALDPYAVAGLVGFTGPIDVDGVEGRLDEDNLVEFLLVEQYATENEERVDLLEAVSEETISLLLGGALPGPVEVASTLGPLVDEGRIVGWAADGDEQRFFDDLGLTGRLPDVTGSDGVAVVLNNAGANKLDVYLDRELAYAATVDPATGATAATATLTLTNRAPTSGFPDGVIGNYTGDPTGTNRVLLSLYSTLPVTSASVRTSGGDVTEFRVDARTEAGWTTGTSLVAIPPAQSVTITYELSGTLTLDGAYSLAVRPQPLVSDEVLSVSVVDTDGRQLVTFDGPSTQARTLGG